MDLNVVETILHQMNCMIKEYGVIEEEWYRSIFNQIYKEISPESISKEELNRLSNLKSFISTYETKYATGSIGNTSDFTDGACWVVATILKQIILKNS